MPDHPLPSINAIRPCNKACTASYFRSEVPGGLNFHCLHLPHCQAITVRQCHAYLLSIRTGPVGCRSNVPGSLYLSIVISLLPLFLCQVITGIVQPTRCPSGHVQYQDQWAVGQSCQEFCTFVVSLFIPSPLARPLLSIWQHSADPLSIRTVPGPRRAVELQGLPCWVLL